MKRIALTSLIFLVACASQPSAPAERNGSAGSLPQTSGPDPRPLARYDIPSGSCGMILWTRDGGRIAPIFRSIDTVQATMAIEDELVPLTLVRQDGEQRMGMRARQVFAPANTGESETVVETNLTWGQAFPGGSYVSGGTIKLTAADGWQRILPVAGIAGCKA